MAFKIGAEFIKSRNGGYIPVEKGSYIWDGFKIVPKPKKAKSPKKPKTEE